MSPALLALLVAAAPTLDELARAAIDEAPAPPGVRAEVIAVEGAPPHCVVERAEIPRPPAASGRVALRLWGRAASGQPCDGWAWARVRVTAPALVTARAVAEGEALGPAIVTERREVAVGRVLVPALPDGARAARPFPAGTVLESGSIRVGPAPGEPVAVAVQLGPLRVEETARALPCRAGRACAVLPSGRRVEGIWHEGRIEIASP